MGGSFWTSRVAVVLQNLELVVHAVQSHARIVVKESLLSGRKTHEGVIPLVGVDPLVAVLTLDVSRGVTHFCSPECNWPAFRRVAGAILDRTFLNTTPCRKDARTHESARRRLRTAFWGFRVLPPLLGWLACFSPVKKRNIRFLFYHALGVGYKSHLWIRIKLISFLRQGKNLPPHAP